MSVRTEHDGTVTVITIDRPEVRNAVDGPTADALAEAFRSFDADDGARVGVLTGAGGVFCSGADLTGMLEGRGNRVEADGDGPMGPSRMLLTKPVLAAIEGYAVAGGLELALWCDLRIAARDAIFGVFCRRWGVPLIDGGTVRLPRLVGLSHALDLILTGRGVAGDEASRMGLANRLSEPGRALEDTIALAQELAALPQVCLRSDRQSAYEQHGMALDDALGLEFRLGAATLAHDETRSGIRRFASGAGRHGEPG
jgi:enoyl-CoA hydratase